MIMAKNVNPEFDFPRVGGSVRGAREFFDAETVVDADIFGATPGITPKRWNGTSWVPSPVKRWNGVAYVSATVRRWNGAGWV